jgi:hypothetical protein
MLEGLDQCPSLTLDCHYTTLDRECDWSMCVCVCVCVLLRYTDVYDQFLQAIHTITRDVNYLSCLYGPHLCERWTRKLG